MKARIKATGEIINVAKDATVELDSYNKYGLQETYFLDAVEIINEHSEEELKQAWGRIISDYLVCFRNAFRKQNEI